MSYETRIQEVIDAKDYPPTDEQRAFIETVAREFYKSSDFADKRTIVVATAVAGAGKTASVLDVYRVLSADLRRKYVLFVAFNVKARDEMVERGVDARHAKTLNGLGHANLARYARNRGLTIEVVGQSVKTSQMLREANPKLAEIAPARRFASKLMGFLKAEAVSQFTREKLESIAEHYGIFIDLSPEDARNNYGIDLDELEERTFAWVAAAMRRNNAVPESGEWVVDYDDQVYLPVVLGIKCFQNDLLVVDEAQDLSLANKKLIDRCLKRNGLLVLVGDDYQCIYAWRGCPVNGLQATLERAKNSVIHTPLTYNFRSGQQIIDLAAEICPDIKCGTGREAVVRSLPEDEFEIAELGEDTAVLSRTRAPLIGFALECLKLGKPFTFRIALSFLVDAIDEATDGKRSLSIRAFKRRWNAYVDAKRRQYELQDADQAIDELDDVAAIMALLLESRKGTDLVRHLVDGIKQLEREINESNGALTLSTMHGAKGLQWGITYLLGYDSIGKNCRRDWQEVEARNLRFVAVTRAKNELVFINPKAG